MDDKSPELEPDLGEGIHSIGDMLTQRQRRRFKPGDTLAGRYKILGELGQGGMGLVFRCLDEVGGIEVAVKMLPPEVSHDSGEMEEVRENFQLVSRLAHPNIATVRTLERDPGTGEFYLVMELAEGSNLRHWRKKGPGGRRPLAEALPLLRQVASALDHAHSRKVIHRDIKPSNIMIAPDGTVKVLDFGLAAQIHTSISRVSHVRYGTSGTGPYMAPEQWRGQFQDARTDQYALAVMAYEMLVGVCPFEGADMGILRAAVLEESPARPDDLGDEAWSALQMALSKDRSARFATCAEFVDALSGARRAAPPPPPVASPTVAAPAPPPPRAPARAPASPPAGRPAKKSGVALAWIVTAVFLAVAGLVFYLVGKNTGEHVAVVPQAPPAVTNVVAHEPAPRVVAAPSESELAARRAYEAATAAAREAQRTAAPPVRVSAPVAQPAAREVPRGGLRITGPSDTEVWSGAQMVGRANADIAGLPAVDTLIELRSASRGKLTLWVTVPTNSVLQVRAPYPEDSDQARNPVATAWDARRTATAERAAEPVSRSAAWDAAVAAAGRSSGAAASTPVAAGTGAWRKDQLYAMGQWYLFWPGDDNDVYLWFRDQRRALEIVGDSNGWWKRLDGTRGVCVFSTGREQDQAFYNEPWKRVSTGQAKAAQPGSFVVAGKNGSTKFVYDGSTITITLTDGGVLSLRSTSRVVEFRDYTKNKLRYD